ncbi:MAG: hypothetical protein ACJASY_002494, partial [Halioglobus sp.]
MASSTQWPLPDRLGMMSATGLPRLVFWSIQTGHFYLRVLKVYWRHIDIARMKSFLIV